MKKLLCLLSALIIAFSFTACGEKYNNELTKQQEQKITENWNRYLQLSEKKYSAIKWAAEYLAAFAQAPDVASYRRAVSAAETVGATLSETEIPAFDITAEDVNNAFLCGVDISFLEIEFSSFASGLYASAATWQSISRDIITEGFWKYGTEYLEKTTQLQLEEVKLNAEYLRLTTNYLLLTLGKTSFDEETGKKCPTIFPQGVSFLDSLSDTEEAVNACLDALESTVSSYSELSGIQTANTVLFEDAVASGGYSEIHNKAVLWDTDCFLIPCPSWNSLPGVFSYRTDDTEEIKWTSVGENLSDYPEGLILQYDDISKTEFRQYLDMLEETGITCTSFTGSFDDAGDCRFIYSDGENSFAADWKNNTATLYITQKNACFCPLWYKIHITK